MTDMELLIYCVAVEISRVRNELYQVRQGNPNEVSKAEYYADLRLEQLEQLEQLEHLINLIEKLDL